MKKILTIVLIYFITFSVKAQNFTGGYNFNIPASDSSVQRFFPKFDILPITDAKKVTSLNDKFLVNGIPYKFWGANLVVASMFPNKENATKIAAHAAKMGINLFRFHGLDNNWGNINHSLFVPGNTTRVLNPTTLDKLDYFLFQLKNHGIYSNINLNVLRDFNVLDGVIGADSLKNYAKGAVIFDPQLIALQKEYAQQLLGHVNPYTGIKIGLDPSVAMVEIINENTLHGMWKDNSLRPIKEGGNLLFRQNILLDSLYNEFLVQKYTNQANLLSAWNIAQTAPDEKIIDGNFTSNPINNNWAVEQHNGAIGIMSLDATNSTQAGSNALKMEITNATGTEWHVQAKFLNFSFGSGKNYLVKFKAKSSVNRNIGVTLGLDVAPYSWVGGSNFNITTSWQEYSFVVNSNLNAANIMRFSFNLGNSNSTVYFDEVSVKEIVPTTLNAGEDLDFKNIKRTAYAFRSTYAPERIKDETEFYINLQKNFLDNFKAFLKNDLNIVAPITGTNALTGIQQGLEHINMDYLDDHSYHAHPYFPGGTWDLNNYTVDKSPMVKNPDMWAINSAFSGLAMNSKPFTISEYNHSFPNRYKTEMVPIMAAYASFHGADGIMFFNYNDNDSWNEDKVAGFFDLHRDHSIMGLFPTNAFAYRNGLIAEANPTIINYTANDIYNSSMSDNLGRWDKYIPYNRRIQLTNSIRTGTYNGTTSFTTQTLPVVPSNPYKTSTNETTLNTTTGILETNTPKFVSLTGFLQDAPNKIVGPLELVSANKFGVINWLALENSNLNTSTSTFLAVSTVLQNSSMIWNIDNTSVGANFGQAPTTNDPLVATLKLQINSPAINFHKLTSTGAIASTIVLQPTVPNSNIFEIKIDQAADQTMWYALEHTVNTPLASKSLPLKVTQSTTQNLLNWTVSKTTNFQTFIVQKSENGTTYVDIKTINANSKTTKYSYQDAINTKPLVYYRLLGKTANNETHYSNTVSIEQKITNALVFPNPVQDLINVSLYNEAFAYFNLYNKNGDLIKKQFLKKGLNTIKASDCLPGSYYYEILNSSNIQLKKGTLIMSK